MTTPTIKYTCWLCKKDKTGSPAHTLKGINGDFDYCHTCWRPHQSIVTPQIMKTETLEKVVNDRITELQYAVKQLPDSPRKRAILEYTENLGASFKDYQKLGVAQAALEFYAKQENWLSNHPNKSEVEADGGNVAKDALDVLCAK